jgi:hypothetical protein
MAQIATILEINQLDAITLTLWTPPDRCWSSALPDGQKPWSERAK